MENVDQTHETNGTKWDQINHIGKHDNRLRCTGHHAEMERVFARRWEAENNPPRWLNRGQGTAEILMCVDADGRTYRDLSQDEATAMATLAQWLGTNCGFSWLTETLREAGYDVKRQPESANG